MNFISPLGAEVIWTYDKVGFDSVKSSLLRWIGRVIGVEQAESDDLRGFTHA